MAGRLAGKVAIISGGATGMGGAASRLFAAEGAKVAIVDRNAEAAAETAAAIKAAGGAAAYFVADVSDEAEVEAAVKACDEEFGTVTVLFNHAGTIVIKPFLETTFDEWEWLHAVNVHSMFLMTRAVLPGMIANGGGVDRLHLVDLGGGGDADGSALRHHQGRLPHVRARHRRRVPRPQHPLQRGLPGLHPHAARPARSGRVAAARRRRLGGGDRRAAGPHRRAGGSGAGRRCSWPATRRASSTARICSSTTALPRSEAIGAFREDSPKRRPTISPDRTRPLRSRPCSRPSCRP